MMSLHPNPLPHIFVLRHPFLSIHKNVIGLVMMEVFMKASAHKLRCVGEGQRTRWPIRNFLSDCCSEPNAVVATVKLCVIAGNEVGSQDPDGSCRGRHIQAPERDCADISVKLGLLGKHRKCLVKVLIWIFFPPHLGETQGVYSHQVHHP